MTPILALIITNILWGASPPIYKYALNNIPPFTFLFLRFFIAALIFFPFVNREHLRSIRMKDWILILAGTVCGFTIQIGLLCVGLTKTDSINSSIILVGAPVLLYFFSILFLREKSHPKILWGILISTIGVSFIIFAPLLLDGNMYVAMNKFQGNILYVLALLGDVASILLFKQVSKKISPFTLTFLAFAISSFTFLPFMEPELKTWNIFMLNFSGFIGLAYAIVMSSVIAYYFYFYGIKKIKGEEIGIFGYLNPIVTVLVAIPLLGEIPNRYFIIGSVLIGIGLVISEFRFRFHRIQNK